LPSGALGPLHLPFSPWLKPLDTPLVDNLILLNNYLVDNENAHNQRGFSNVTYTTAGLSKQMLTTKLSTLRFTVVGLDNRKLWFMGRSNAWTN